METAEPRRMNDRTLSVEPRFTKSSTLNEEPIRPMP
jgi:hypothetical protein